MTFLVRTHYSVMPVGGLPPFGGQIKTAPNRRRFREGLPLKSGARRGHPLRKERRVILMRRKDDDHSAGLHPVVEIDDVLIGHADAAGRNRLTDILRLIG